MPQQNFSRIRKRKKKMKYIKLNGICKKNYKKYAQNTKHYFYWNDLGF